MPSCEEKGLDSFESGGVAKNFECCFCAGTFLAGDASDEEKGLDSFESGGVAKNFECCFCAGTVFTGDASGEEKRAIFR